MTIFSLMKKNVRESLCNEEKVEEERKKANKVKWILKTMKTSKIKTIKTNLRIHLKLVKEKEKLPELKHQLRKGKD